MSLVIAIAVQAVQVPALLPMQWIHAANGMMIVIKDTVHANTVMIYF